MIGLIQHGRLTGVIASAFLLLIPIKGQTGMIQHLDASVEASIITDGTSRVTSWKDQTTYSNDAIPNTGSVYKVQENELTWLDFGEGRNVLELFSGEGSDTWLDQSPGTGGFCVIQLQALECATAVPEVLRYTLEGKQLPARESTSVNL